MVLFKACKRYPSFLVPLCDLAMSVQRDYRPVLQAFGHMSHLLLACVVLLAALEVRMYQDAAVSSRAKSAVTGVLCTAWLGVGGGVIQDLLLGADLSSILAPIIAAALAYFIVRWSPDDIVYRNAQSPGTMLVLGTGVEVARAKMVGYSVIRTLTEMHGRGTMLMSVALGALRGSWGWLCGRPILGKFMDVPLGSSWTTTGPRRIVSRSNPQPMGSLWTFPPPWSVPTCAVGAVILAYFYGTAPLVEEIITGLLIAALVSFKIREVRNSTRTHTD